MGLMDKLKEAADEGVGVAKKGLSAAKDKAGEVQLRRRADDLAKRLGYLIVKERTQAAPVATEVNDLVREIVDLETQLRAAAAAPGASPPEAGAGPDPGTEA